MIRYFLILIISLVGLVLSAQSRWSWGAAFQAGPSGERMDLRSDFNRPGVAYGNDRTRTLYRTSFATGLWVNYTLSPHWNWQAALHYRQQLRAEQRETFTYTPAGTLRTYYSRHSSLQQQSVELPLRLRCYTHAPARQWRPFLSIQLAPAYLLNGDLLVVNRYSDITTGDQTVLAEHYTLDFTEDYVTAYPWQLTYGAELGLAWSHFALSLVHNRTVNGKREDIAPRILCGFSTSPCPIANQYSQTRILDHTQLQLQYQF
jgi:hypothetical protein